jgi:hypothetical protein
MVVLRIACVACLAALVAGGCGGGGPSRGQVPAKLPPGLAGTWATEAEAIATADAAGQSCRARALAVSLHNEVTQARGRVPSRLRSPLLGGVKSLADRIVCTPAPPAPVTRPAPPHKPPEKHPHHDHHKHQGDGGDQGKQG